MGLIWCAISLILHFALVIRDTVSTLHIDPDNLHQCACTYLVVPNTLIRVPRRIETKMTMSGI
jgi:hypothetical protein